VRPGESVEERNLLLVAYKNVIGLVVRPGESYLENRIIN
jgi:hypothetical protein